MKRNFHEFILIRVLKRPSQVITELNQDVISSEL